MAEGRPEDGDLTCVYCGYEGRRQFLERRQSVKFDGEVWACRDVILCLKTEMEMRRKGLIE